MSETLRHLGTNRGSVLSWGSSLGPVVCLLLPCHQPGGWSPTVVWRMKV